MNIGTHAARRMIMMSLLLTVSLLTACSPPSVADSLLITTEVLPTPRPVAEMTATVSHGREPIKSEPKDLDGVPNRLIHEQSPYLLQHAYNPIDWYPWGEEAFEAANRENKPIFLSIGYSTCHWCHVMEEESFSDPEVAALMNETFVAIKVDREERPDIDAIYMNVAMLLNGSGGWPLNVIMTPDQKPFFAATYIPKEARFQHIGLMALIPRVQQAWSDENDALLNVGEQIAAALNPSFSEAPGAPLGPSTLDMAHSQLARRFDPEYGGFGPHPKFPSPHALLFLLRQWQRSGDAEALAMVETTLQAMRLGGIFDQLGYGFHRYSTDAQWLVPHFEKMLYDQAMLAIAYTEAFQATGDEKYRRTADEIFAYVLGQMRSPEGGFYSAEDADSEGEEGLFYLWTSDEIEEVLDADDAALAVEVYRVTDEGNFIDAISGGRTGHNILHLNGSMPVTSTERLDSIRRKLFAAREERIHPYKDDKILTDWNGLMIAALARAARAFDDPRYGVAASRAADFLLDNLRAEDGRLLHRYRNGDAALTANVDDYAFLVWGLLELYEATFELRYLEEAFSLNEEMLTHFWDVSEGGLFFTPDDGEALLARPKEGYDGAIPSGNSVAMLNLLRLGRVTADTTYEEKAAALSHAFANQVRDAPTGFTHLLNALDFAIGPSLEIVIVGDPDAADTKAMLAALRGRYLPNKVVLLRTPGEDAPITELAEFTRYQYALDDTATAYVCRNYECEFPTTDIHTMLMQIESSQSD